MFNSSKEAFIAIDLAPDAVRVLDVTLNRGAPTIKALAAETLPEGTADSLPDRHLQALGSLLATQRIRTKNCVAAVPSNLVVTRSVMIDLSKPQPPEEQIRLTLQNILTYDLRDLLFDFWNVTEPNDKSRSHEVLVVATQRSVVHKYLAGLTKLGLACKHLDVSPCALASLIAKLVPNQESMVGTIALGETIGYFAVVEKQRVLFWRPFDLPQPKNGQQAGLARVGDEISKCVSHMVGSLHLDNMTEVLVFGHAAQDKAFADYLQTRFNLQVRSPSPFDSLPGDAIPAALRDSLQPEAASHYAAALGLALQPIGGIYG
jgi:Tfp pilus assembly PilM family ATPase